MRSQIPVDIFADPGTTIDATAALEVAGSHGMRNLMARLLPYTVTGPAFVPDIHQHLTLALANLHTGNVAGADHHLQEATECAPQSWQAIHQPASRTHTPAQTPTPGRWATVHAYPPKLAATLATSYAFHTRDQATTGAVPYLLANGNGLARATWRQQLRNTSPNTVAVIAVSSPRNVDDQRWRTIAAHTAATVDRSAPWTAVRRPQPDGVLVFVITGRTVTAAIRRRIATMATTHLHPAPRPATPSPRTATSTPPPPSAAHHRPLPRNAR